MKHSDVRAPCGAIIIPGDNYIPWDKPTARSRLGIQVIVYLIKNT